MIELHCPPPTVTLTFYRIPIIEVFPPLNLQLLLAATTSFYPKSLFPRCSNDEGCLRWRKARTYIGIPGYACETTGSARRQPDHIHSVRLIYFRLKIFSSQVGCEPIRNWYAAQKQGVFLPTLSRLSYGGSPKLKAVCKAKNRTMAGALGPIHLQVCEKQGKSSEEVNSGVDVYQGSARV